MNGLHLNVMMDDGFRKQLLDLVREQVRPMVKKLMEDSSVLKQIADRAVQYLIEVPPQERFSSTAPKSKIQVVIDALRPTIIEEMRKDIREVAQGLIEHRLQVLFESRFEQVTAFRTTLRNVAREVLKEELKKLTLPGE